jgi:hypothetical protein
MRERSVVRRNVWQLCVFSPKKIRKNRPDGLYSINHLADGECFILIPYYSGSHPAIDGLLGTRQSQGIAVAGYWMNMLGWSGRLALETYAFVSLQANGRKDAEESVYQS